jgi:hypothetical protein
LVFYSTVCLFSFFFSSWVKNILIQLFVKIKEKGKGKREKGKVKGKQFFIVFPFSTPGGNSIKKNLELVFPATKKQLRFQILSRKNPRVFFEKKFVFCSLFPKYLFNNKINQSRQK